MLWWSFFYKLISLDTMLFTFGNVRVLILNNRINHIIVNHPKIFKKAFYLWKKKWTDMSCITFWKVYSYLSNRLKLYGYLNSKQKKFIFNSYLNMKYAIKKAHAMNSKFNFHAKIGLKMWSGTQIEVKFRKQALWYLKINLSEINQFLKKIVVSKWVFVRIWVLCPLESCIGWK